MIFDFYEKKLSANYRVILMDSRGHGRSMTARQSFTIHDMACDAAALLDHLGIAKAILLGFSDGANIALEFACCFPERTLAVISASGNALSYGLRFPVRLAAQFTGCALSFLKNRLPDSSLRLQLTNQFLAGKAGRKAQGGCWYLQLRQHQRYVNPFAAADQRFTDTAVGFTQF